MNQPHPLPQLQLHHDYVRVSQAGLRRMPNGAEDAELASAVERLVGASLAIVEGDFLTLQRPEYGEFPEESLPQLHGYYATWLQSEQASIGEQLLYGLSGFWQHWWNLMHERTGSTLQMDLVMPDVPELDDRNWMEHVDTNLLESVLAANALHMRVLVPPREPETGVGMLATFATQLGFEVRVRSSPFLFAVYGGDAAVISERESPEAVEGYYLTRRPSLVMPLQQVFNEHWESGIPWDSFAVASNDVLEYMALGWTDTRIADVMGVSLRTVSRRIADAMAVAGVSSRFELGMKYITSRS